MNSQCRIPRHYAMPIWLTVVTILLGTGLFCWQYLLYDGAVVTLDGPTYFEAWRYYRFFQTHIDRAPLYPMLLHSVERLFGGGLLVAVLMIQWGVFVASMQLVWRINCRIGTSKTINIASILILFLIPGSWVMNNITMPEAVCQAGIVTLIYLSARYLDTDKPVWVILSGLMVILLIFTKPMFIFLLPVMALFWLLSSWKNRKAMLTAGIMTGISMLLVVAFCHMQHRNFGVFGLTRSSSLNTYYCLRQDRLIIPSEIPDSLLRKRIEPLYNQDPGQHKPFYDIYWDESVSLTWEECDYLVNNAKSRHPVEAVTGSIYRFVEALPYSHTFCLEPHKYRLHKQLTGWNGMDKVDCKFIVFPFPDICVPIFVGWIITLSFLSLWTTISFNRRKIQLLPLLIVSTMLTAYVTVFVGSMDCWGRILTPVNPLLAIMAASVFSILNDSLRKFISHYGPHRLNRHIAKK